MNDDDPDDDQDVREWLVAGSGQRLDVYAAKAFARSRSAIKKLVEDGALTVDGRRAQVSRILVGGERLRLVPPPVIDTVTAEDFPLQVLWEDDDLLVVNKAAGMVVHPAAGQWSGTLCNALRFHRPTITTGGALRPGLVHRLDKDTSGTIVIAKHDDALHALASSFAQRHVEKWYIAFTATAPQAPTRFITGHVRSGRDRRRFSTRLPPPAVDTVAVKRAVTDVVSATLRPRCVEVLLCLRTGRTHQIRAHLADTGTPILSDGLYDGPRHDSLSRHALHAHRLVFPHPRSGHLMAVEAPLPAELEALRA